MQHKIAFSCSLSHFGLKCDRLLFFCWNVAICYFFCLQFVSFLDVYVDILFLFCLQFVSFLDVYVDVLFLFGEYGLFRAFPSGQAIRSHRFAVPLLSLTLILRRL